MPPKTLTPTRSAGCDSLLTLDDDFPFFCSLPPLSDVMTAGEEDDEEEEGGFPIKSHHIEQ